MAELPVEPESLDPMLWRRCQLADCGIDLRRRQIRWQNTLAHETSLMSQSWPSRLKQSHLPDTFLPRGTYFVQKMSLHNVLSWPVLVPDERLLSCLLGESILHLGLVAELPTCLALRQLGSTIVLYQEYALQLFLMVTIKRLARMWVHFFWWSSPGSH